MAIDERVIERIRKMLTLANCAGATEGERDNALRMAHATLAKYNLDLATVQSTPGKQRNPEVEQRVQHQMQFYGRPWARLVCQGVAELLFCTYLYVPGTGAKKTIHYFIGSHSNSVTAGLMAQFLVESITREGRAAQRRADAGNAYFRSFATAAAARVAQRCIVLRDAAAADDTPAGGVRYTADASVPAIPGPPGTALVLRDVYERERSANVAFVEQRYPELRDKRSRQHNWYRNYDSEAAIEGDEYGNTVSLDRQIT